MKQENTTHDKKKNQSIENFINDTDNRIIVEGC